MEKGYKTYVLNRRGKKGLEVGLVEQMPFALEDGLKATGENYEKASADWGEHVVVGNGGKLITGQNPASATATGEAILKSLE